MAKTVSISNATIDRMLADPQFTSTVPCLVTSRTTKKKHCNGCNKKQKTVTETNYAQAKKCIGALGGRQLKALKSLFDADNIKVSYTVRGQRISKTL